MVQQGRRRLTTDMISSPTNFVHFDGPSFGQTRTVDLDEARCRVMFDRLQKSSNGSRRIVSRFMFRSDSPPSECCFPASLLLRPSSPGSSSSGGVFNLRSGRGGSPSSGPTRQLEISAPFNFVHLRHVSLDGIKNQGRPVSGSASPTNSICRRSTEVAAL